MSKIIFHIIIISIFLSSSNLSSQSDTSYRHISAIVTLDSFVVTATRKGFNVDDFIRIMREDESFYNAFQNLRMMTYQFDNHIKMHNKKGKIKGAHEGKHQQYAEGNCRTMETLKENITGNYYKKKRKHKYYTGQLLEHLFFTKGKQCYSYSKENWDENQSGMERHINELKKLIFSPGDKANVPLIGDKTAIFEPDMMPYYNYSISSKSYRGDKECYVFTVKLKPQFESKKEGKTVIKFLETYFEKKTFQVIARDYRLSHKSMIYDFDVTMSIKLKTVKNKYVPEFIEYDGRWDIPAKAPEIGVFNLKFHDFE